MDGFAGDLTWSSELDWDKVQFMQGDMTDERHEEVIQSATHVYMFDKLFRVETKQKLLSWLHGSSTLRMLACYIPSQLRSFCDTTFHLVHQLGSLRSTGSQQFKCYFYCKRPAGMLQVDSNSSNLPRRTRSKTASPKRGRSHSFDPDQEWMLPNVNRCSVIQCVEP